MTPSQTELYENTELVVKEVFNQIINKKDASGQLEFGELATKLQETQVFVTNHYKVTKLCNSIFDDGKHIFITEKFARYLIREARENENKKYGLEPVLLLHAKKMLNQTQKLVVDIPVIYKDNLVDNVLDLYDPEEKLLLGLLKKWDKPIIVEKEKLSEVLHKAQMGHVSDQLGLPKYEGLVEKAGNLLNMVNIFGSKNTEEDPKKLKL